MRDFIYFPGFEVPDINWLKFALLYFDRLRPIVPEELKKRPPISREYMRKVYNETDLIEYYNPNWREVLAASNDAAGYIKHLLDNDDGVTISRWREQQDQKVYLYKGKSTGDFARMCVEQEIAIQDHGGLLISNELSFIYMSILASCAAENAGINLITDNRRAARCVKDADLLSKRYSGAEVDVARSEIEFFLPRELNDIPLDEIIKLREQKSFRDIRVAFMQTVSEIVENQEKGLIVDVHAQLQSARSEILDVFKSVFKTTMPILATVSGFHAFKADSTETGIPELAADSIGNGLDLNDEIPKLTDSIKKLVQKKHCRKYIAEISQLT